MQLTVYLSGEIHTNWREEIKESPKLKELDISFLQPVTDHALSDDCGVLIMGKEDMKFWHDNKGAKLNAIRTRTAIEKSDVVIVKFGEKYKQWNAAFDAGYAAALGKSIVVMHGDENQHALKEIDAAALAVTRTPDEVAEILFYTAKGMLQRVV